MSSLAEATAARRPAITDPVLVDLEYRYWQRRILIATIVGYALFYFVRKNLPVAMPVMERELGIAKTDLGMFLTLHGLLYGVSKFFNGMIADRANARWFMSLGLAASAIVNIFFGIHWGVSKGSMILILGSLWTLNGWVQGMGFPPCARLMTHWFPPRILATKMSIWNSSHSIGAALVVVLCGYLVSWNWGPSVSGWQMCFFVPAGLALLGALYLAITLRDTPESLGLPEVEGTAVVTQADGTPLESYREVLYRLVFANPYMWLISLGNFCVYTVRYGIVDWGPTFLLESKHIELKYGGWMLAAFEASGIVGMLASGWITDKLFGGRGARTCMFYMASCTAAMLLFWKLPNQSFLTSALLLCVAGFFVYGPQCLVGIIAANMATKRAAATAGGFTGVFGYASTVLSGYGVGFLVERFGWDAGFLMFVIASIVGAVLFAACWPARPHGYRDEVAA